MSEQRITNYSCDFCGTKVDVGVDGYPADWKRFGISSHSRCGDHITHVSPESVADICIDCANDFLPPKVEKMSCDSLTGRLIKWFCKDRKDG